LNIHGVRTGIASQILSAIESDKLAASTVDMSQSTRSLPAHDHHLNESVNSEAARAPPPDEVPMDPVFVHSQRELEDIFSDMLPFFEGRESEENWINRDKSVTKMRQLLKGNAPNDYHTVFMTGMKQMQAGIIKVASSLRTTMSSNGCYMVQELARSLGPALDPMVEIYLQTFIKMCAATKHIAAQNGNQTVETIYQYVSYNIRTMQHIWVACQDKNVQPRTFAAAWLRTTLERQAAAKSHFESTGGLELAEKCVKHGLNDAQPKVKEAMRATYWALAKTWPNRADLIMNSLDAKAKTALEKDSHNPNAPNFAASTFRASTMSRAGGAVSKSSVRDAIMAARKKAQADSRPNSAMASVSPAGPVKSKSFTNPSARQPSARLPSAAASFSNSTSATSSKPASNSNTTKPHALMSGAARRPVRRPEITRPATADPYASRRLARPETPSTKSPAASPRQDTAAVNTSTSASKNRDDRSSPVMSPFRQSHLSPTLATTRSRHSSMDSKTEEPPISKHNHNTTNLISSRGHPPASPRGHSPASPRGHPPASPSATRSHIPISPNLTRSHLPTSPRSTLGRPTLNGSASMDTGIPVVADDTFTMELPTVHKSQVPAFEPRLSNLSTRDDFAEIIPSLPQYTRRMSDRRDSPITTSQQASPQREQSPPKATTSAAPASPIPTLAPAAQIESAVPQTEEHTFQIHEDEVMEGVDAPDKRQSQDARSVLSEVPVNEFSQSSNRDDLPAQDSPPQSTQKPEVLRSRKLLLSGIERIRGRTLDAHGFRKVLELIKSSESGEIFGSVGEGRRFDDLCSVLLDYIVESSDAAPNSNVRHSQELRRQATSVIRTVLNAQQPSYRKWIAAGSWYPRCLTGALDARNNVEGSGLLVKDIEALAGDIVSKMHPEEGEKAIIEWLEHHISETHYDPQEQELDGAVAAIKARHGDESVVRQNKAMALALRNLTALLASTTASASPLSKDFGNRAARLAVVSLRSKDAEVRKSSVELATQLHGSWPTSSSSAADDPNSNSDTAFWSVLEGYGLQESARNLIVYFIARRERST
jgi:CLIP-associating protein 1/2